MLISPSPRRGRGRAATAIQWRTAARAAASSRGVR